MPNLTKPCRCNVCKQPMASGEAFRWSDAGRLVASHTRGAQDVLTIDCKRPAHPFDCLTPIMEKARAADSEETLRVAAECGIPADQMSRLRAHMAAAA